MPQFDISPDGYITEEPLHSASRQVAATWPNLDALALDANILLVRVWMMIRDTTEAVTMLEGLTLARASGVGRLLMAGDKGLTISDIANLQDVTQANASKLIDGLVKDGWVAKSTNPDDGRSFHVRLTPWGRERAEYAVPQLYSKICEIWSGLTRSENQILNHLLAKVRIHGLAMQSSAFELLDHTGAPLRSQLEAGDEVNASG